MVKICYRVSDCALCHSDIEKMCCFCCFFLPLQAIIMSCIWNTQMFYTRHVLFIYKHPDLLQNLQRRTLQIWAQKTKKKIGLAGMKDACPCLCDKGCTSTTHTIKSEDYQIGHQGISCFTSLSDVSFPFWSK